jgi:hypothetical protein
MPKFRNRTCVVLAGSKAKLEREQVRFLDRQRKTNGPVRKVLPMKLKR